MARLLAETERGNGSAMYGTANVGSGKLGRRPPAHHSPFHRSMESSIASQAAVMCSDTDSRAIGGASVETLRQFMSDLRRDTKSPTADIWALWIAQCRHWGGKAIEAYRGARFSRKRNLTSASKLIHGTCRAVDCQGGAQEDKVCTRSRLFVPSRSDRCFVQLPHRLPLPARRPSHSADGCAEDAGRVRQRVCHPPRPERVRDLSMFGALRGIEQSRSHSFGHCSMAHPSLCTAKKLRAYFVDGVVPAYDTRCEVDDGFLFPHPDKMAPSSINTLSTEDGELRDAMWELSSHVNQIGMGPSRI